MNRKQRRTQGGASASIKSADDIPMGRPQETTRQAKTLYELAAERQAALMPQAEKFEASPNPGNVVNVKIGPNGEILPFDDPASNSQGADSGDSPVLDTLLLASSLSALHFTLEALTVHQYADELRFRPIFIRTIFVAFPTLAFIIHLLHGHIISRPLSERGREVVHAGQALFFLILANVAGCYLIQITNDKGYMAVMKTAPSVGTLWVWAILELGLVGAIVGVVGPGAYAWYNGYGIF